MSDALDKSAQATEPGAHAQKQATTRWNKQSKKRNKENVVVETKYELVDGHKVVMLKRKKSGSVYRTLIGSIRDSNKERQASLKAFAKKEGLIK